MNGLMRFPIRLKILVSVLFIVTAVVSVITLTMADLFHSDKRTYIRDLVSVISMSAADEARSLLSGYAERLRVYAPVVSDELLNDAERSALAENLFREFPELVSLAIRQDGEEVLSADNFAMLGEAGISQRQIIEARDLLVEADLLPGEIAVRNSSPAAALPAMTLATVTAPREGQERLRIDAVLRLDSLMRIADREGFAIFIVDADGTFLAHADHGKVAGRAALEITPEIDRVRDRRSAGLTTEYERDGEPMTGAYASLELAGAIAGTEITSSAAYLASRDLLKQLVVVALMLLVSAAVVGLVWAHRITRPMERLSEAADQVAQGRFDVQVGVRSRDEIGTLAGSFNRMAGELDHREQALKEAHAQLIQSEKLAAFGQLGAGIAHEVKNPLAGILGCAQLALRKAEPETSVHRNLSLIEKETRRCKEIIENLLKFARQERAVLQPIEVAPVVEDAMAIVRHQLELAGVKLESDLAGDLPRIKGNANQLQQVLMNLMINAQQAMEGQPGHVRVTTRLTGDGHVELGVADDGPGMTEEVRAKLFEPFFTTKPGGKGTGLGLSVSFGIIKDHGGEIVVDSRPGEGATFTIRIPALVAEAPAGPGAEPAAEFAQA